MPPLPTLYTLAGVIRTEERRSFLDGRRMVRRTVAEYTDPAGAVYRKSFEASAGIDPVVPSVATAQELRDLAQQW